MAMMCERLNFMRRPGTIVASEVDVDDTSLNVSPCLECDR